MATQFVGFSGNVWLTVYNTLAVFQQQLAAATSTSTATETISASSTTSAMAIPSNDQLAEIAQAMFETLNNASENINIQMTWNNWNAETLRLQAISVLPLVLDPITTAAFQNRLSTYEAATATLKNLIVNPPYQTPKTILNGNPTIPYPGWLEWMNAFNYETPPAGLGVFNFVATAQDIAVAFENVAAAILAYQGSGLNQLYDTAVRQAEAALFVADLVGDCPIISSSYIGNASALDYIWNQVVTLPALLVAGDTLSTAPFNQTNQQNSIIRNALLTTAGQVSNLLLSLNRPVAQQQISTATLRNNETLQDFATRTTGNVENWIAVAALNNLVPPYVGQTTIPGIAGWGAQLILPTPGASQSPVGLPPNYNTNFLGTDIYFGPINGSMPLWNGDFQVISGYGNLKWALGRRLQTSQGTLIYHPLYGSRIPPEVGNIQTTQTAGHVAAYGEAALASDPRVANVPSATATLLPNNQIAFNAVVQPGGFRNNAVTLNEVI